MGLGPRKLLEIILPLQLRQHLFTHFFLYLSYLFILYYSPKSPSTLQSISQNPPYHSNFHFHFREAGCHADTKEPPPRGSPWMRFQLQFMGLES